MILRIEEALIRFNSTAEKTITVPELGAALWPDSAEITQMVSAYKLVRGETTRIPLSMIRIICDKLKCTPNFLCGFNKNKFDW
jgi:DNA-binding Xre family transcriptional regulator